MKRGIVLIVTGHSLYGRYAYNLAISIKAIEDFSITLMYTPSAIAHLSTEQIESAFDFFVALPPDAPKNTSCKLLAGKYSPYEETLVLDVDMIWLPSKKPSDLFEETKGSVFTGITEGKESDMAKHYFFWASLEEIKTSYQFKAEVFQWRTEVMYFNSEGKNILNRALEICQNPKLTTIKLFGEAVPDELGINIACAEFGIIPHAYKWQVSYWPPLHNNFIPAPADLYEKYYLLSMGSNFVSGSVKKTYNTLMRAYCNKMKVQHMFDMESKRNYLPERAKI